MAAAFKWVPLTPPTTAPAATIIVGWMAISELPVNSKSKVRRPLGSPAVGTEVTDTVGTCARIETVLSVGMASPMYGATTTVW